MVHIGPTGELNLAALARTFPRSGASLKPGLPGLLIHHMSLSQGRVTFSDESDPTHASALFESIDLELNTISTLPKREGRYVLKAQLPNGGGKLSWNGELSLKPLQSRGQLELVGLKPAIAWRFFQDELDLAEPQGMVDGQANYRFAYRNGVA